MNRLPFFLATLLAGAVGCGGSVVAGTGGSGGATSTGTSTGTNTSSGTTGSVTCPATEPTAGACSGLPSGLQCTYGTSVRPECRDQWICESGSWTTTKGGCVQPPAGDCPTTQPSSTTVCATQGDVCTYGDTLCLCDSCVEGPCMAGATRWQCAAPPTTTGCPPAVPNDGTACTASGLECSYGYTCSQTGALVDCTDGVWVWNTMVACAG